jgi:flagellar motor switch protein FliN/FliY
MSDNPRTGNEPAPGTGQPPFPGIDPLADETGLSPGGGAFPAGGARPPQLGLVLDIPVRLSVELGRTEIALRDVVTLARGSVIELDRSVGEALDVRINGMLVGRGEIVVVNEERLGLRFTEIVSQGERAARLG